MTHNEVVQGIKDIIQDAPAYDKDTADLSIIRTTFGLIDPETNKRYNDIIYATLAQITLPFHMTRGWAMLEYEGFSYILSIDKTLREKLRDERLVDCIISLQQRTTLNIAIARAEDRPNRVNNKK